jgi:hypothetical protein
MLRVLYGPAAIIIPIAMAAASAVGGIMSGIQASAQGKAEAKFYQDQQNQERLALERDREALEQERSRTFARARAVSAAQGGDTTSGNAEGILENVWGTFGRRDLELIHDSEARIRALGNRAESAKAAGKSAMWSSIFSGLTGAGKQMAGSSLLRGGGGGGGSSSYGGPR